MKGHLRRRSVSVLSALILAASALVASAPAASATPAQCTPPANGFVSHGNVTGHVVRYFTTYETATSLQWGRLSNGRQIVFAYLGGDVLKNDQVWMDWSRDGGRTWIQCGPFPMQADGRGRRTHAQYTKANDDRWVMRACSRLDGATYSYCTSPWW